MRAVWARSDASWLLSGSAVYATSLIVRVVRWSRLLAALGRVRIRDVGEVLLVGNAVNNILPARLGELVRADYGKQRLGQTRSSLLATIFVERLADLAAIVAALLSGIVVVGPRLYDGGRARRHRHRRRPARGLPVRGCARQRGARAPYGKSIAVAAPVRPPASRRLDHGSAQLERGAQAPVVSRGPTKSDFLFLSDRIRGRTAETGRRGYDMDVGEEGLTVVLPARWDGRCDEWTT